MNFGWSTTGARTDYCNWYGITCVSGFITVIDLRANMLVGDWPTLAQLGGTWIKLQKLLLSGNHLRGDLTPLGDAWVDLVELDLSGNQLTGTLPATLGNKWQQLQGINLAGNKLVGAIPV